jgi:hypothetical protein
VEVSFVMVYMGNFDANSEDYLVLSFITIKVDKLDIRFKATFNYVSFCRSG